MFSRKKNRADFCWYRLGFVGWIFHGVYSFANLRALGGIFLIWDKHAVKCIEKAVGTFSVFCKFKSILDQYVWAFFVPNADSERHYLWEELPRVFS